MKKIGFIGAGNMATAIIKGLMAQNDGKADFINVFDVSEEKCAAMKNMGANVMTSADEIAKNSSIVVLAVKPQNYPEVLESLKNSITTAKTVVSIAAGISIAYVRKGLECDCPVVRVMTQPVSDCDDCAAVGPRRCVAGGYTAHNLEARGDRHYRGVCQLYCFWLHNCGDLATLQRFHGAVPAG